MSAAFLFFAVLVGIALLMTILFTLCAIHLGSKSVAVLKFAIDNRQQKSQPNKIDATICVTTFPSLVLTVAMHGLFDVK